MNPTEQQIMNKIVGSEELNEVEKILVSAGKSWIFVLLLTV
jgi:hypothetical protein